jgi:heat shock protein HtpX
MNTLKTAVLMSVMMILFLLIGSLLGGERGMMIAFLFSLVLNFGSYWFSDKIVLAMYGAKQVTEREFPRLFHIVENLASNAMLPMPKVYVVQNPTPNAFATGRNPQNAAVAVTTGILGILNDDELSGVIAHELAHVKHRDILIGTIAATLVGTITLLARMAGWAMMFGGGGGRRNDEDSSGLGALVLLILSPIIAMLIQMAISRSREFSADEGGSAISGKPLSLASALNKLSRANEMLPMQNAEPATAHMFIIAPFSGKSMMKLFSTHPPIEERIKRLEEIAAGKRFSTI